MLLSTIGRPQTSPAPPQTHTHSHPLSHPPTHPPTHSLTHPPPTHSLIHPPTHPLSHPPTHHPPTLTHPPTRLPRVKQVDQVAPKVALQPHDVRVGPMQHLDDAGVCQHAPQRPPQPPPQRQGIKHKVFAPRRQLHQAGEPLEGAVGVGFQI